MSDVVLSLREVSKRFGEREVLRHVSLDLHENEVVCLVGSSGSGKSTLLRCANLLESIDGGEIVFIGQPLAAEGIDADIVRRHIGIVFQSFNLFPHLSVAENVALAPRRALGVSRQVAIDTALGLLGRIGLKDRANDYPDQLSGGQQQRVAIIRALAMNPRVLLLDEVTSALDPTLVGEVLDLLTELAQNGTTMLIATHEMTFARQVAHRVALLNNGELVEVAPTKEFFENPRAKETQEFLARVTTP